MIASAAYERLSALDNAFLVAETPSVHMHVGAVQIFEAGSLENADGGVDADAFTHRVASLVHLVPRCRQKLKWIPLENHPVWVDDPRFDLDYHIRLTSLPRPGTDAQLKALSAQILEQQLDRNRPLWEMWLVEGLAGGRFAVVSKFHHCMIDGVAGADLVGILLSTTRETLDAGPEVPYWPRPAPSSWTLFSDASWRRADLPMKLARELIDFVRATVDLRTDVATRLRALRELFGWATASSVRSPLNGALTAHRRFDWHSVPLEDVRAVSKAAGCSLNDVVLATVAGALRRFLASRGSSADGDFRVSAPVNLRRGEPRPMPGNHVSAWLLPLPIGNPDVRSRLQAIHEATSALKRSRSAVAVEMMMAAAEWAPASLISWGVRLASGPMNMVVTNVPGPHVPLYLLGARLEKIYPLVPLLDRCGLGIALFSYNGELFWGFNASYELVPDLGAFVRATAESFDELRNAYGVHGRAPAADALTRRVDGASAARRDTTAEIR
ncbi:MAG: wax ester/triacylglycerol synthase family O-acyltransferase [Thermodesulfobacteriota bacterium]